MSLNRRNNKARITLHLTHSRLCRVCVMVDFMRSYGAVEKLSKAQATVYRRIVREIIAPERIDSVVQSCRGVDEGEKEKHRFIARTIRANTEIAAAVGIALPRAEGKKKLAERFDKLGRTDMQIRELRAKALVALRERNDAEWTACNGRIEFLLRSLSQQERRLLEKRRLKEKTITCSNSV